MHSTHALASIWLARCVALAMAIAIGPGALFRAEALAATATLRPSRDTTIYGPGSPSLSNGAGEYIFAGSSGTNGGARPLRTLLAFELAGQIPAGATVQSASLTLTVTSPMNNANMVTLRRLLADWGEGTSRATSGEGGGAAAAPGDATWNARSLGTALWATPGGDFSDTVSAAQAVRGTSGTVTFAAPALAADVQAWVGNPAANFGWILVAQDEGGPAVRFSSRQRTVVAERPSLVVEYTVGPETGAAPVFTTQPASQTVAAGATVTLTAVATGTPAPTLQWRKDAIALVGATADTLTLPAVTDTSAGLYTVVATNPAGTATSAAATLTVAPAPPGPPTGEPTARLSNLSVRAAMAAGQTLIVGFSVSGGSRSVLIRGVGPTLADLGVGGEMADPSLEVYSGSVMLAQNNDWGNDPTLGSTFAGVGAFPLRLGSRDAAILQLVEGARSVQLKGTGPGVALVELYDTGSGLSPRLTNVSARNQVGRGANILIFGFVVQGTGTKNVLIRAIGPGLSALGVGGVLADPQFDVLPSGSATPIASNDNWSAALASTFTMVGAFPLAVGSRDAALVTALTPGAYTVQVSGADGGVGEALVEIYEVP